MWEFSYRRLCNIKIDEGIENPTHHSREDLGVVASFAQIIFEDTTRNTISIDGEPYRPLMITVSLQTEMEDINLDNVWVQQRAAHCYIATFPSTYICLELVKGLRLGRVKFAF